MVNYYISLVITIIQKAERLVFVLNCTKKLS